MKKVLLLSVCLAASCILGGGKLWADVTNSNGTLTINVTNTPSSEDESALTNLSTSNDITKIVFTGNGKVTSDFVSKLNGKVSNVTVLDMGGITIDELTSSSIPTGLDFTKVTEFTLPKTKIVDEKMTFPQGVLDYYTWSCPNNGITKLIFPEGYTDIANNATINESKQGNYWFIDLSLPSTLKKIGDFAFLDKRLKSLALPANVESVGQKAFWVQNRDYDLLEIKLNSKLRIIGAGAFGQAHSTTTQTVLQVPASVQFIGPMAFANRFFQEVYFLGTKAPICPMYKIDSDCSYNTTGSYKAAFSADTNIEYNGNNGYQATNTQRALADTMSLGRANRENYYNGAYIAALHYPSTTSVDEANKYRDQTRVYDTSKETYDANDKLNVGAEVTSVDKDNQIIPNSFGKCETYVSPGFEDSYLGRQYIWPSQTQMNRAYITAYKGLQWDGTTQFPTSTTLTSEEEEILKEAGVDQIGLTPQDLYKGTRMFVLANNDAQSNETYDTGIKKDGKWWTLCVPFNMTKKQVEETFGSKTELCLFTSVTREIEVNGRNHIKIVFNTKPLEHKTSYAKDDTRSGISVKAGQKAKWTSTSADATSSKDGHRVGEWDYSYIDNNEDNNSVEDNDTVIWAHESYMIKPSDGENSDLNPTETIKFADYKMVPGNPLPSLVRASTVYLTQDNEADYKNCYRFIGNYTTGNLIPQFSYVFSKDTQDNRKFVFYTGTTSEWKANKSLIESNSYYGGQDDYENFFNGSTEGISKVKQTTCLGYDDADENSTTGIDDVQIVIGNDVLTPIYTIDGKLINLSGDTTGLTKGIYVKAGKKFVVK